MPGMDKILRGILRFRASERKTMVHQFEKVRDNPQPTAVFFSCMDSRMMPSRFTNTKVGDMFMVRNAGNLIPNSCHYHGYQSITAEPGALELGCVRGDIRHVIVCGHSDCKAMNLLMNLKDECHSDEGTPLEIWMKKHGADSLKKFSQLTAENDFIGPLTFQAETEEHIFEAYIDPDKQFSITDKLSQVNCLQQLANIASYPFLKERLASEKVRLHAMWFDIYTGNVHLFSRERKRFVEVTEESYEHLYTDSDSRQSENVIH